MSNLGDKQAERALAAATARFEGLIASAMDAIISVDAGQHIVLFNPAAEEMFGVSAQEATGQPIDRFIPQRFRAAHAHHVEDFGRTGATTRRMGALGKIFGLRANGEEFPIEASISRVETDGETLFTVILRDITRRERAEAELKAHADILEQTVAARTAELREKVVELEAFSYSLSHDLRAPIRAIQSFAGIALADFGEKAGAGAAELLQRVISAAQRMDTLIQDVLALSSLSKEQVILGPVDVEKLLQEIILERPELQPPRADIRLPAPLPLVCGHEACLTQCLTNLLSNAVKFVAPGVTPRIRIWAELKPGAETRRHGDAEKGDGASSVRLWVEDNGIGIPPGMHGRIFEIFRRLHQAGQYEGTGIGLAIVRKAAERMGGKVGLESELGQGSRFWIELPQVVQGSAPTS